MMAPRVFSDRQRLHQRIAGVQVVEYRDLGGQIVGQIVQLTTAPDRHHDVSGALLDGRLDDSDGIEDRFDGTAQV